MCFNGTLANPEAKAKRRKLKTNLAHFMTGSKTGMKFDVKLSMNQLGELFTFLEETTKQPVPPKESILAEFRFPTIK
jgi:hypothetical protein